MSKQGITITLRIDGVRETLAAFRDLPKDANDQLRKASTELASALAVDVAAAGRAEGGQAALVASTVKARRDRLPLIVVGGSKRLGSRRKPAYKMLFGSEFGSNQFTQYKPHLGSGSYWVFASVDGGGAQARINREWNVAADAIVRAFGKG